VGPTLAHWLETAQPVLWEQIRKDEQWHRRHYGYSNALAQPYNHTILPLTSGEGENRDIETQIAWGIAAYEHSFGHKPAGMWLPEMAVDRRTLEVMARHGITYTLLSGSQLDQQSDIDRTKPARVVLDGERSMTVFFRDDFVNGMLTDGSKGITQGYGATERFARERLPHYQEKFAPLTLLAMDAETFGHHLPESDRFLSHLLTVAAAHEGFGVTSLEYYLNLYGVTQTASVRERTSWSCSHGLQRWEQGCDCERSGGYQPWKEVLRHALNNLSQRAYELYEHGVQGVLLSAQAARDGYIGLHEGWLTEKAFWRAYGQNHQKPANREQATQALLLLEAQYFLQQAYTSCAWYWESYTSGEVRIVLDAARRAMQLLFLATGSDLQDAFVQDLQSIGGYPEEYIAQPLRELPLCAFEQRVRQR
jgi:hypothetical protein